MEIAGSAAEVLRLAHELETNGNPNLRADAAAAAILARAAAATAEMLVQVNESAGPRGRSSAQMIPVVLQRNLEITFHRHAPVLLVGPSSVAALVQVLT